MKLKYFRGNLDDYSQSSVCQVYRNLSIRDRDDWGDPTLEAHQVPDIRPSARSNAPLEFQQQVIDTLKKNNVSSYVFCGPTGVGKTFMVNYLTRCMAVQSALEIQYDKQINPSEWRDWRGRSDELWGKSVFRIQTVDLLQEHLDYSRRPFGEEKKLSSERTPEPHVTAEKITKCSFRPRLALEEFGRINDTDTRRLIIFGLINTMNNCYGQLLIDTNLTPDEIEQNYGHKDMRRLRQLCWFVNYNTMKITPPTDEEKIEEIEVKEVPKLRY